MGRNQAISMPGVVDLDPGFNELIRWIWDAHQYIHLVENDSHLACGVRL